jgi:hypothetical protein
MNKMRGGRLGYIFCFAPDGCISGCSVKQLQQNFRFPLRPTFIGGQTCGCSIRASERCYGSIWDRSGADRIRYADRPKRSSPDGEIGICSGPPSLLYFAEVAALNSSGLAIPCASPTVLDLHKFEFCCNHAVQVC